jgi:two-component sensor histidine kinase
VAEVASGANQVVRPRLKGSFGFLPSEYATPLALVLTELVTNAVEHGLKGKEDGHVTINVRRSEDSLRVSVQDDGAGLSGGLVGEGLGTQIVRTLVEGELGGNISWSQRDSAGTNVNISIPLKHIPLGAKQALTPTPNL